MKTLLVLAEHPELANGVRSGVDPAQYRVVHRMELDEAEPLLKHGLISACILDVDLTSVQGVWTLEKLRRRLPQAPVIVYTSARQWEWEEEAYLLGVNQILNKPVRPRMLNTLLERLTRPAPSEKPALMVRGPAIVRRAEPPSAPDPAQPPIKALEVLRDFSAILTHSLCAEALLKQFLLLLREIIGVNRAAIFLRQPFALFGGIPTLEETRRLHAACAIGLSPGLLEHFELSFEAGIGGFLFRQGRILRRDTDEALGDIEVQKEFELMGTQVAIPILDRESLVGVAAFDGRITGEPLVNGELELIFHLLEDLGLAVKNIWLHDQLVSNHEMMADILRQLSCACIVVGRDLTILHANKTARKYFTRAGRRSSDLEFSDLPHALGTKIYQVLKTGTGIATFKHHPEDSPEMVYHVTVVPFQRQNSVLPNSALMVVENYTHTEQLQRLELETSNLRLVKTMADRLAHEIGNALVPLSTHQQLLNTKYNDPEFRHSLDVALADTVKRVSRLINQMRFLAKDSVSSRENFPLAPLIEEAYQEAQQHQPVKSARLKFEHPCQTVIVSGDRSALKHALTEILINALQANTNDSHVGVRLLANSETNGNSCRVIQVEFQDNGAGFTSEAAKKVPEPFFTTRHVGLGLGLTVSKKILETHQGELSVVRSENGPCGIVRISIPLESIILQESSS